MVFTALQKKSWLTLTLPLYSQLRSSFQVLIFMVATFIVHNVYGESAEAWPGAIAQKRMHSSWDLHRRVLPLLLSHPVLSVSLGVDLKWEMPQDDEVKSYSEYIDQTWMNRQFRLHMWNYCAYSGPRTSNQLEGWHNCMKHNCMNKTISISDKSIWESTRQSGLKEDLNGILTSIETLFTGFLLLS